MIVSLGVSSEVRVNSYVTSTTGQAAGPATGVNFFNHSPLLYKLNFYLYHLLWIFVIIYSQMK